jgi:hypothetical protein
MWLDILLQISIYRRTSVGKDIKVGPRYRLGVQRRRSWPFKVGVYIVRLHFMAVYIIKHIKRPQQT